MADPRPTSRGQRLLRISGALAALVLLAGGLALVWQGPLGPGRPDREAAPSRDGSSDSSHHRRTTAASAPSRPDRSRHGVRAGVPRRIAVPALGVDAEVDPIRLTGSTLVPPGDVDRVGWWSDGARPGAATGTALLTGHTVHAGGGVFDRLGELAPHDRIEVGLGRREIDYRVRAVWSISTQQLARRHERLFRQHGRGRLVLVTCTDWDGEAYRGSVVVLASPVGRTT